MNAERSNQPIVEQDQMGKQGCGSLMGCGGLAALVLSLSMFVGGVIGVAVLNPTNPDVTAQAAPTNNPFAELVPSTTIQTQEIVQQSTQSPLQEMQQTDTQIAAVPTATELLGDDQEQPTSTVELNPNITIANSTPQSPDTSIPTDTAVIAVTPTAPSVATDTPVPEVTLTPTTQPTKTATKTPTPTDVSLVVFTKVLTKSSLGEEVVFHGTGKPGAQLQVMLDTVAVDMIRVESDGKWRWLFKSSEPGEYAVHLVDVSSAVRATSIPVDIWVTVPNSTPTATNSTSIGTVTPEPIQAASDMPTPMVTSALSTSQPITNLSTELRVGPGKDYPQVSSIPTGTSLQLIAQNEDGTWYQLESQAWISVAFVENLPSSLPIVAPTITPVVRLSALQP